MDVRDKYMTRNRMNLAPLTRYTEKRKNMNSILMYGYSNILFGVQNDIAENKCSIKGKKTQESSTNYPMKSSAGKGKKIHKILTYIKYFLLLQEDFL